MFEICHWIHLIPNYFLLFQTSVSDFFSFSIIQYFKTTPQEVNETTDDVADQILKMAVNSTRVSKIIKFV